MAKRWSGLDAISVRARSRPSEHLLPSVGLNAHTVPHLPAIKEHVALSYPLWMVRERFLYAKKPHYMRLIGV